MKYIDAIHLAENAGMEVIIIDSLSHAWAGEGGALDKQGKVAARTGNSYTAWREITPEQNKLMSAILQAKAHVIADIRAKQDYVQEKNDRGKTVVKSVGMGLVYRDQLEYEFTTVFMLDNDHVASASKDRTGMFTGQYFVITPETGAAMHQWLSSGGNPVAERQAEERKLSVESAQAPVSQGVTLEMVDAVIKARCAGVTPEQKKAVASKVKEITGGVANYMSVTDPEILNKLYEAFK